MKNHNKRKRKSLKLVRVLLVAVLLIATFQSIYAIESQTPENFYFNLEYGSESAYDPDNDGKEGIRGVIDLSVKNSKFGWDLDESKLCTRWEVYSLEKKTTSFLCYGSEKCCSFMGMEPSRDKWNEAFYLTYGMHGASENNIAGAQSVYVDYSLDFGSAYSDIYVSRWAALPVSFSGFAEKNEKNVSMEDVLRALDAIKNRSAKIREAKIMDWTGNEAKSIDDGNITLVFSVIDKNELNGADQADELVVSVNDFKPDSAYWSGSGDVTIKTGNPELEDSLERLGADAIGIVSVQGMGNFIDYGSYYGYVRMRVDEPFDKVIFCHDDIFENCVEAYKCRDEFDGEPCYKFRNKALEVFVPHFSSVIVALSNITVNITLDSPDEANALASGEGIYLNFTSNYSASANYSLDSQPENDLGNGTSFSALLEGNLSYGVLPNGNHTLRINVKNLLGSAALNYSFFVNDIYAPIISINMANNTAFSGANAAIPVNVSSSEYSRISYRINNGLMFDSIDLGGLRQKALNITFVEGQNNLTINASDFNSNSKISIFTFNFTLIQAPSCSDAIQNGDETGIDCGGSCPACIYFNVTTERKSYNLTDSVYVTVIARANSVVNMTIMRQNAVTYVHNFIPVFYGAPISEIRLVTNTSGSGNYTINATMRYFNITEGRNYTFEVLAPMTSPIALTITPNATSVNEGNPIHFKSSVSGNSSGVSYKWDFMNDGGIDSAEAEPVHTYPSNGTFLVNLTVSDGKWNQSDLETIVVSKIYNVTITVVDNSTSGAIQHAQVELDDFRQNTSSDGKAGFSVAAREYRMYVKKPGYVQFSNKTEIKENSVLEVRLIEEDIEAPVVEIIGPENNSIVPGASIALRYAATDKSAIECRLYLRQSPSPIRLDRYSFNVVSGAEHAFELGNLSNGTYEWQVQCIDSSGNSRYSNLYSFNVDQSLAENQLSVNLDEQDKSTADLLSIISETAASIDGLGKYEKEAADAMNIREKLEKARIAIDRSNRDLHSLKWRKLNQSEIEEETNSILKRIENVKATTPVGITVLEKSEFVKYPSKDDISRALETLVNSTNLMLSKKEFNRLVQENHKLQSAITVTTKHKIVDVEFISGKRGTITLIHKTISAQKSPDNTIFYEVIPKEIAKNLSEIELLFDYEVIDPDPVVEIDLSKISDFAYQFNKIVGSDKAEELKSILLNRNIQVENRNMITGLVATAGFSGSLIKTADARLIIEAIIIVLLLAVFVYYQFGDSDKLSLIFAGKDVNEIKAMIGLAMQDINSNNYEKASSRYKEISYKFSTLEEKKKNLVKPAVVELLDRINMMFIMQLLEKADGTLKSNDRLAAHAIYSQIHSLYRIVPKSYKAQIADRCVELHKSITSAK